MSIVRIKSLLIVLCLIAGGLGVTAAPAAAQLQPIQRVTLRGMWADVRMQTTVTAGDSILIWVDLEPHDPGLRLHERRVALDLTPLGRQRTAELFDSPGDGFQTLEYFNRVSVYAPPGDVMLRFTASADLGRGGTFELPLRILPPVDGDGDTLPDVWEAQLGLSIESATGAHGPGGDPDGDGLVNRDEYLRRSHPRGIYARYFPEGVDGDFFGHAFDVVPLSGFLGTLLVRTFDDDGLAEAWVNGSLDLSPRTTGASFAQIVESDVPFAASRSTMWPGPRSGSAFHYGSHGSEGTPALSTRWLFAEGVKAPFDTYLLLMNPSIETATVTVTYVGGDGVTPVVRQHTIGPERRATIAVNADAASLASTDVAFIVDSSRPIAAERSIYLHAGNEPWGAGTSSVGAPAPATAWYFAEGLVNAFFDTYVLLLNPGDATAQVSIEILRADGLPPLVIGRVVPPRSRVTVHLNSAHPELADNTSFGFVVRSPNAVPIVAERTMWWDDPVSGANWVEGHTSVGASEPATRWSAASHYLFSSGGATAYLLLANPGDTSATVRVSRPATYGVIPEQTVNVPARSRITLDLAFGFTPDAYGVAPVLVESLGPSPLPIVAERSVYANRLDAIWALGSNSMLTPAPVPQIGARAQVRRRPTRPAGERGLRVRPSVRRAEHARATRMVHAILNASCVRFGRRAMA